MGSAELITKLARYSDVLVVYNEHSGNGTAKQESAKIHAELGIPGMCMYTFLNQLKTKKEASQEALRWIKTIALITGDGSALSVLNALKALELQLENGSKLQVLALDGGGESVVPKHLGTQGDYMKLIKLAMSGKLNQVETRPLRLQTRYESSLETHYAQWSAQTGLSEFVLQEVNRLRQNGFGNKTRRYLALYNVSLNRQVHFSEPLFTSDDQSNDLDHGFISAAFPWYTSKFRLSVPEGAYAIHQQIAGRDVLLSHPWYFANKLLIELLLLHRGMQLENGFIKRTPLYGNQVGSLSSLPNLAVDSESMKIPDSLEVFNGGFDGYGKQVALLERSRGV